MKILSFLVSNFLKIILILLSHYVLGSVLVIKGSLSMGDFLNSCFWDGVASGWAVGKMIGLLYFAVCCCSDLAIIGLVVSALVAAIYYYAPMTTP